MKNREEFIAETVTRLQSIKTIDDFRASKDEILEMIVSVFKMAIGSIDHFMENLDKMSPGEISLESKKFQDENYFFAPEIGMEIDRIEKIPGTAEHFESFKTTLEPQIGVFMEEFQSKLANLMDSFMEGTLESFQEGMLQGVSDRMDGLTAREEEPIRYEPGNPETPDVLYDLYMARTCHDLEDSKEYLVERLENELQEHLDFLARVTENRNMDDEMIYAMDENRIFDIRQLVDRLNPEMEIEFNRLKQLSDTPENVISIQNGIMKRVGPKMDEVKDALSRVQTKS